MATRGIATAALFALMSVVPRAARAQPTTTPRYAEEPTGGVGTPTTGISGEHDALAVSANPAGLHFLGGSHLALVIDGIGADDDDPMGGGKQVGLFAAGTMFGGILPRVGWGLGLEFMAPPRVVLAPDPGTPKRFTLANSLPLGQNAAFGFAWRHFYDESGAPLHGLDTFDLGISTRLGAHLAAGFMLRDLFQPTVAGVPVERRYELEVSGRPTGDDRIDLALGGRVGEIRTDFTDGSDIDGWLRASWRVFRGVYLRGQVETRGLFEVVPGPAGTDTVSTRELRMIGGIEVSFGGSGAAGYVGGGRLEGGTTRFSGGALVLRVSEQEVPSVLSPEERIERLELTGALGERELTRLIAYLRKLRRDDAVVALLVQIDDLGAGWASVGEIRRALIDLRARGKHVYAHMVAGTTKDYYLAAACDKIYVDPAGGLRLSGMSATSLYFKGLFDKLGIVAQFAKIEEYKSAPEAYTREGPTEPAFTSRNELYDSLYENVVQGIAAGRHIDGARARVLIDNGPYTAGELEKIPDLVDAVLTPEELGEELVRELGSAYPVGSAPNERDARWDYPSVAIIYINGDIIDGESTTIPILGMQLVGGETISRAIAAARASPAVEAIILRINSPGGSALASELMAREVFKTRGVKPIICSLGDVAASGGYFAAAGCDTILADPMTITGSIGIFNGKFDFSGLAAKLGVTWTTYKRGRLSDMDSLLRAYDENEMALMKRKLFYFYGRFIQAVADGRGLTTTRVDEIGRGRVWTGVQARQVQLVDGFGGIGDAIQLAKKRMGLRDTDEVRLILLPGAQTSLISRLLGGLVKSDRARDAEAEARLVEALLPDGLDRALLQSIPGSVWAQPGTPQARLPFSIVWSE